MKEKVKIIFHKDYEKNSSNVEDMRVFRAVERKFEFLKVQGLRYPSLNAKALQNKKFEGVTVWEFYITKKWRCFFTYNEIKKEITVLKVGNHL